jgi:glycosyltransferase involved in cell wall biosynthesis
MTTPLVTVAIPAFNSDRTLRRAVASVLAQTDPRWLLRLSDDASSDDTWAICESLAGSDPRIAASRQPARRMYLNFGDLAATARTPYFVWLAADDHWAPEFLASCLAVIERRPDVVSVLPGCAFIGADPEDPVPVTASLEGPRTERLRRYLAHPGGTRMYGLMRTDAVRRAFPARNMNAYDWFLMIGLLGEGAQAEVRETLLYRERSDWMAYVEIVDTLYRGRLWRRFPILDMSLRALAAGRVPLANLGDLVRLNLRKHEEYLAVAQPQDYLRRSWLFRRLGLPLTCQPGKLAAIAARLIRNDPDRRAAAAEVLRRGMARGEAVMAMALGRARRDGLVPGDAAECFAAAAASGDPDGAFHFALQGAADGEAGTALWARVLAAAHNNSPAARAYLVTQRRAGRTPREFAAATDALLDGPAVESARR